MGDEDKNALCCKNEVPTLGIKASESRSKSNFARLAAILVTVAAEHHKLKISRLLDT